MIASKTMLDALQDYLRVHYTLTEGAKTDYSVSLRRFCDWYGSDVPLALMSADLVRPFLSELMRQGLSARTVNNKRSALLLVWKHAAARGWCSRDVEAAEIPRFRESRRFPTAWDVAEVSRILAGCDRVPVIRGIWHAKHWRALTLTIYDTSLRIGCLLRVPRENCDLRRGVLYVPGDLQKGRADTLQKLSEQTCGELAECSTDGSGRLFPWPLARREIWRRFRAILESVGLPATRRDLFHKLRRTSYTHVAARLGVAAATEHAAHRSDLSRYYLDPRFLDRPEPISILPRP